MNLLMLLGHHRPYPLPSGKYIRSIEPFSEEDRQQKRILNTERRIESLRELIQDIGPITQGDAYPVLGMTWTRTAEFLQDMERRGLLVSGIRPAKIGRKQITWWWMP